MLTSTLITRYSVIAVQARGNFIALQGQEGRGCVDYPYRDTMSDPWPTCVTLPY